MTGEIDAEVRDAIALANSPAARLDPIRTPLGMLTMAIHTLVYVGGEDAAVEVLQGAIGRIRAGHFPLPTDPVPEPTPRRPGSRGHRLDRPTPAPTA